MSHPLSDPVQIAMPTYNGAEYIREALTSLLQQTHNNVVIHVMDNASDDGTSDIVDEMTRFDRRVIHHRSSALVAATENWVRAYAKIDRSGSNYFMWASDDDLWHPTFIEKLLSQLQSDRQAVLAFPRFQLIDNEGQFGETTYDSKFPVRNRYKQIKHLIGLGKYSALYGVIRMEAIKWDPILHEASFGSDLWFLMRMSSEGHFSFRQETLFFKRAGGISETNTDPSASKDSNLVWLLNEAERDMIMSLRFSYLQKLYLFNRLKVSAKSLHRSKSFGPLINTWATILRLQSNPRALGLRSTLRARGTRTDKT